ncbi:MAG TPA: methionyl-tRNA formyltransferase [Candidatus Woesebacteria bacterium]|nr:methionyl-tRNA formyltransferase [Candidatus Woesebacteria bacterium]
MVRILFFGSAIYSVIVLKSLLEFKNAKLVGVVTKPDKPKPNPVAQFCHQTHLPLFQTEKFDPEFLKIYQDLNPDLVVVVAFGPPFFTTKMINFPRYKIVNIHPSPLPAYRGAAPAPWQIINGETTSAVTFFVIDELPDHGPIIQQIPFPIDPRETSKSFYQKAFNLAAQNTAKVLSTYCQFPQKIVPQDETKKSYFPRITRDSAMIDWSWEKIKIERFIRAMNDWPIAWTIVTNQKNQQLTMKVFSAELIGNDLTLLEVQIEGKNKTLWKEIEKYYQIDVLNTAIIRE